MVNKKGMSQTLTLLSALILILFLLGFTLWFFTTKSAAPAKAISSCPSPAECKTSCEDGEFKLPQYKCEVPEGSEKNFCCQKGVDFG